MSNVDPFQEAIDSRRRGRTLATAESSEPGTTTIGIELFDSSVAPAVDVPNVYLRFVRDVDGQVQTIYLGTVT